MKLSKTFLIGGVAALGIAGCATTTPPPPAAQINTSSTPPMGFGQPVASAPAQPIWQASEAITETLPSSEAPPAAMANARAVVTPPKPYTPVSDLMARVADIPPADPLTSEDFASPPGARFGHVEY